MSKKNKRNIRCITAITLCAVTIGSMTACQKSPESSVVVNKDLDKMIEKANTNEKPEPSEQNVSERWKTTFEDKKLKVTVNVDADIVKPETDDVSVFRLGHQEVTQELVSAIQKEIIGNRQIYDGALLDQVTRGYLEDRIRSCKRELKGMEDNGHKDSDSYREYKEALAHYESLYEDAPAEIEFDGYQYDGNFYSIAEKAEKDPDNWYYSWLHSLAPDGSVVYSITDGSDGTYAQLYAINAELLGNYLSVRTSEHGYQHLTMVGFGTMEDAYFDFKTGEEPEEFPIEKAKEMADDFLNKMSINTDTTLFTFHDGRYGSESIVYGNGKTNAEGTGFGEDREYYLLRYTREINGVPMTVTETSKNNKEANDPNSSKYWFQEAIQFRINERGVVGFDYIAPITITETVVEHATVKSFEECKEIFQKMVPVIYAWNDTDVLVEIDHIEYGYTEISEPDSYDTGLIVPTWVFSGRNKRIDYDGQIRYDYQTSLTVNAIDGSIIDRQLGY